MINGNSYQALEVMKMIQNIYNNDKEWKKRLMEKNKFFKDKSLNLVRFSEKYIEYLSFILKTIG